MPMMRGVGALTRIVRISASVIRSGFSARIRSSSARSSATDRNTSPGFGSAVTVGALISGGGTPQPATNNASKVATTIPRLGRCRLIGKVIQSLFDLLDYFIDVFALERRDAIRQSNMQHVSCR